MHTAPIERLPIELHRKIFEYLDSDTAAIARNVCRLWYEIITCRPICISALISNTLLLWAFEHRWWRRAHYRVILGRQCASVGATEALARIVCVKDTLTVDKAIQYEHLPILEYLESLKWNVYRECASERVLLWYHRGGDDLCPWGRLISGTCPLRSCPNYHIHREANRGVQTLPCASMPIIQPIFRGGPDLPFDVDAYKAKQAELAKSQRLHKRKRRAQLMAQEREGWSHY